jgi:MbtH protein
MGNPFDEEVGTFLVLANEEGQYSLWPAGLKLPGGWMAINAPGTREECLALVEARWTDIRTKPAGRVAISGLHRDQS